MSLSQYTKDKLISIYKIAPSKITILPGGVNTNRFVPGDKTSLRHKLNIPDNRLYLFTARNLVPRMGLENLIRSISILQQQGIEAHLVIAGQGMLKNSLNELITSLNLQDHVVLAGFLPDDLLVKHYQAADFFILPTLELEGFGLATLEAMACATPVLATPIGGSVEILEKFDRKFLFKDTSPEAMAGSIARMSDYKKDPDKYRQLCGKARSFVLDNYSLDKSVVALENFLST